MENLSRPCRGRARQTRQRRIIQIFSAEHGEGEAACERDTGNKNHTVVLGGRTREQRPHTAVLKDSADHAVAEFRRQKTVLRVSATRCCKLPDRGEREHLPRTDDHAVAQYYEVVLERCQGVRGVVIYHKMALEEERSFQQWVSREFW